MVSLQNIAKTVSILFFHFTVGPPDSGSFQSVSPEPDPELDGESLSDEDRMVFFVLISSTKQFEIFRLPEPSGT